MFAGAVEQEPAKPANLYHQIPLNRATPCALQVMADVSMSVFMPPNAYTGMGRSMHSFLNLSQPRVGAPGWLLVGSTGDSTAKPAPGDAAFTRSSRLWQDAAHRPAGGGALLFMNCLVCRCTPSAPVAWASSRLLSVDWAASARAFTADSNAAMDRPVCFCILSTNQLLLYCVGPQALHIVHCQGVRHD